MSGVLVKSKTTSKNPANNLVMDPSLLKKQDPEIYKAIAGEVSRQNGFFMGAPMEFMELLESFREDGGLKGLEVT